MHSSQDLLPPAGGGFPHHGCCGTCGEGPPQDTGRATPQDTGRATPRTPGVHKPTATLTFQSTHGVTQGQSQAGGLSGTRTWFFFVTRGLWTPRGAEIPFPPGAGTLGSLVTRGSPRLVSGVQGGPALTLPAKVSAEPHRRVTEPWKWLCSGPVPYGAACPEDRDGKGLRTWSSVQAQVNLKSWGDTKVTAELPHGAAPRHLRGRGRGQRLGLGGSPGFPTSASRERPGEGDVQRAWGSAL